MNRPADASAPHAPAPGGNGAERPRGPSFLALYAGTLTLACAALCVQVLMLRTENARLRQSPQTPAPAEALERAGSAGLTVGEALTPVEVIARRDGSQGPSSGPAPDLQFDDGRVLTMLVIASAACEQCAWSMPYFRAVAATNAPLGVQSAAVEIDASEQAMHHEGTADLPVLAVRSAEATWLRRVPMVPAVLLVDDRGVLVRSYFGVLSPRQQEELEGFIKEHTGASPASR
jgi:hypothetical protein